MNREFLFRGQPTGKGGIWMVGIGAYKTHTAEHLVLNAKGDCVEVVHLCQYTEFKDKYRKKIFEGDILFQGQELLGVVCISKRYGVSILKRTTTWSLINFVLDSDFDAGVLSDIEVRGNIYDNPKLIE